MCEDKTLVQISTRVECDVAELIQMIATAEKRSVSAQLAVIVEKFVAEHLAHIGN